MKLSISRLAVSIVPLVTLLSSAAVADDQRDFYFQEALDRYYNYPVTARVLGMGRSSTTTSVDSSAIVGNPAGLGFMRKGEVSGTYGHSIVSGNEFPTGRGIEQETNSGMGLVAIPLGQLPDDTPEFGNFGLGWNGSYSDWEDDSFGTDVKQQKVIGAYAIEIDDGVSLGYSLGWHRDRFQADALYDYPMANGFRHTLGTLVRVDPNLTFGATALVGHGIHHALFLPRSPGEDRSSNTDQFGASVGMQYQVDSTIVTANLDYSHLRTKGDVERSVPANIIGGDEKGNMFNARLGVEQWIDNFAVRAGYRFAGLADYDYGRQELEELDGSAYYHAVSLGAGVVVDTGSVYVPQIKLDYGVEYRAVGNDDWEHAVTLSMPFDVCGPA